MKKYSIAIIGVILVLIIYFVLMFIFKNDSSKNYVLKLEANSTTGYLWDYELSDDSIVEVIKDEYKENENKEGFVGVGGTQIYEFKGLKKGEVTVTLTYKQSGTKEIGQEKIVKLIVDKDLVVKKKD